MIQPDENVVAFREVQQLRQGWLWGLLLIIVGLSWYAVIAQILLQHPAGTKPAPDGVLMVIWLLVGVGLPLFLWSLKLVTEVRPDGVYYRFIPLHRQFHVIRFDEIQGYAACAYRPLRDYGGWGVRYGRNGKAYTISGTRGVQFSLQNGTQILIGSQSPEELVRALQAH
jgi:hypothetical protein